MLYRPFEANIPELTKNHRFRQNDLSDVFDLKEGSSRTTHRRAQFSIWKLGMRRVGNQTNNKSLDDLDLTTRTREAVVDILTNLRTRERREWVSKARYGSQSIRTRDTFQIHREFLGASRCYYDGIKHLPSNLISICS